MLDFRFHPDAALEADQEFDFLHFYGGNDVASRFLDALDHAIGICRLNPLLYRTFHKSVRRIILPKPFGEYYLPYVVIDETIYFLAVAHAKRKPLYWRERLRDSH